MIDALIELFNTYNESYERIATLLIILAIFLKLFINRQVTILHFKKTFVSVPSEITFLLIGFLMSAILADTNQENLKLLMANVLLAFTVLVIQYALERWLDDKLSGKISWRVSLCIVLMYAASLILYKNIVFGGIY